MFISSQNSPSIHETKIIQDESNDNITPTHQINAMAIGYLTHAQNAQQRSPLHCPDEGFNITSIEKIERSLNQLECNEVAFVKRELTKVLQLIKQKNYLDAKIRTLELSFLHEEHNVKIFIDKILALMPPEPQKRKYSEISSTEKTDSEISSCSDSESDAETISYSASESDSSSHEEVVRSVMYNNPPPAKKIKTEQIQKLQHVGLGISSKKVITPEVITKAEKMLEAGLAQKEVALQLNINYETLRKAVQQHRIASKSIKTPQASESIKTPQASESIKTPPKNIVLTPEVITKAEKMLDSGMFPKEVARQLNVNCKTLSNAISAGRIASKRIKKQIVLTPEVITKAEKMLESGLIPKEVARQLNVKYKTLSNAISAGRIASKRIKKPKNQ